MAVFNLGSINIDLVYALDHFPRPGETLAAGEYMRLPGGKGANQSVALAAAGADVFHIGAMNGDDDWLSQHLSNAGVHINPLQFSDMPSGHAIVMVDPSGENQIILFPGANQAIDMAKATDALSQANNGDWALLQNETNGGAEFVAAAKARGMNIAYAAAPFDAEVTLSLLSHVDLLMVNAVEAAELMAATGGDEASLGVDHLVITLGGDGAKYIGLEGVKEQSAFDVNVVDTTGAGDCFTGYFLAGLDGGLDVASSLSLASAASALQVTKHGAAAAIPSRQDVDMFLKENS